MRTAEQAFEEICRKNRARVLDMFVAHGAKSRYACKREYAKEVAIMRSMEGDEKTIDAILTHDRLVRSGILQ